MKRIVLILVTIVGCTAFSHAQQISKNALGIRVGDSDGLGAEISYQTALGENNRLELDLGWRDGKNFDGFKVAGLYQWVWHLDGRFNWYAGVGGGLGSYSFENNDVDDETFLFAAGDIGIEYNFEAPIMISMDFRPEFGFGDFRDDLDFDIALGIRYQF